MPVVTRNRGKLPGLSAPQANATALPTGFRMFKTHAHLMNRTPLPKITGGQYAFVLMLHRGLDPVEAYRKAYPNQRATSQVSSIASLAVRMLADVRILQWLDYMARTMIGQEARTLAEHVANLDHIRIGAIEAGDWGSAVRAEMAIGKVSGLYVDKSQVELIDRREVDDLENELARRNPAMVERFRAIRAMVASGQVDKDKPYQMLELLNKVTEEQ